MPIIEIVAEFDSHGFVIENNWSSVGGPTIVITDGLSYRILEIVFNFDSYLHMDLIELKR